VTGPLPVEAAVVSPAGNSSSMLPLDALAAAGSSSAAEPGGSYERAFEPYATNLYQAPFSRIALGTDISPLGIGIKSATVLNTFMDARLMGNFLSFNTNFDVQGFQVNANLHMDSVEALVDFYPWASMWRVSAGVMVINGNKLTGSGAVAGGTEFDFGNKTFFSAKANSATGVTPVAGTGVLGLNGRTPAFVATGGFGKFIPRSDRHWSFPSEFGVVFTGPPTVNVAMSGWVCKDQKQTECSDLSNASDPVTVQFNNALRIQLNKWRRSLDNFPIYPIFSYGIMYSFNLRSE
jgi:hypothetical protein